MGVFTYSVEAWTCDAPGCEARKHLHPLDFDAQDRLKQMGWRIGSLRVEPSNPKHGGHEKTHAFCPKHSGQTDYQYGREKRRAKGR